MLKQLFRSTPGRVGLGISGLVIVGVVVAIAVYIFGSGPTGNGAAKTPTVAPTLAASGSTVVFKINSSASNASFAIDEVLFGQPNTVIGKTSQVTGQILVNTTDPAASQIGQIRVDLSTLVTDNDLRTQTLQHRILETSDPANQYAVFATHSLSGLPTSTAGHAFGDTVSFKTTGDLTIHQVTKSVTFDVQVTVNSATLLTGHAQTTIRYADFGIVIPNVPTVTDVGATVILALDFTAHA